MMRRHGKLKILTGLLIPVCVIYFMMTWLVEGGYFEVKMPLNDGKLCNASLGPTVKDDIEKIKTYSFPEAEKYLEELFPPSLPDETNLPKMPVFVTAASASHYTEVMELVYNISAVIDKYKETKLIVYDLGFYTSQKKEIERVCKCEVKTFPYTDLPQHMKLMKGYAWKPVVIQLAARDHPFVIWMDASVRFTTTDLDAHFERARNLGVMAAKGFAPIAMRTHPKTFLSLGEEACTFKATNEFEATFILIFGNKFVSEFFLKPWVSCALSFGCVVPDYNTNRYINCDRSKEQVYFDCHRFDQSVLSILLYRLYHKNIMHHRMDHTFFRFCKGADEQWYLPQFINELMIKYQEVCF
ncbi:uncharacterized protein LOC123534739 [Mercenaria mercenaria]|uniref:uncharacterized protein LOC123534739 n=1 Tax=Mercenaria mercenaria TaxID=6596 RepID=UPI001E1D9499|nr:uncharacterized protein LOC123534739 [Mercenaria mercenaria]XP_045173067.1 uncharacterized protein LOC123534739 [Mercenaria mercenaria]